MNGASLPVFGVRTFAASCYESRMKFVWLGMLALAACAPNGSDSETPDAAVTPMVDAPPPEPTPMFSASPYLGGNLAIDDVGIRATYKKGAVEYKSNILVSLTETGKMTGCTVTLAPSFAFGSGTPRVPAVAGQLTYRNMIHASCPGSCATSPAICVGVVAVETI